MWILLQLLTVYPILKRHDSKSYSSNRVKGKDVNLRLCSMYKANIISDTVWRLSLIVADARWLLDISVDVRVSLSKWSRIEAFDCCCLYLTLTSFILCKLFGILILGPPHDPICRRHFQFQHILLYSCDWPRA